MLFLFLGLFAYSISISLFYLSKGLIPLLFYLIFSFSKLILSELTSKFSLFYKGFLIKIFVSPGLYAA